MENPPETPPRSPKAESGHSYSAHVQQMMGRLAGQLRTDNGPISPGERAELRRCWQGPGRPAFWRVAVRTLEPAGFLGRPESDAESERNWAALLAGLAETANLHHPRTHFGQAMAKAGVSEARLLRLLRAEGETLRNTLRGIVRQLAGTGQRFDWAGPALLLLSADKRPSRHQIALNYYRSLARAARESEEEET